MTVGRGHKAEPIIAACGRDQRVLDALDVVLTLDNEERELLSAALVLVEAARGTRWQLRWINGAPGSRGAWLTIVVEVPAREGHDPRLGPFEYPCADYEDAKEHMEELLAIEGYAHDRFFPGMIGDWSGRWRLEPVPEWVMKSIEKNRAERAKKKGAGA